MKKYPKIVYPTNEEADGLMTGDDEIVVQEKLDGCLPYSQRIETEDGAIPIGKVVNNELDVKVKSYDFDKKSIVYKEINDYYKNGSSDNWIRVYHNGCKESFICVTPNHEIYTNSGKKQAGDLEKGDELITRKPKLTSLAKDMLIGSLLGDASVYNRKSNGNSNIGETHGENQHNYSKFKERVLGELVKNSNEYHSSYSDSHRETLKRDYYTMFTEEIDELCSKFIEGGEKIVPSFINITDRVLAILFCDDGSTSFSDYQRARATLHVQGFDRESVELLFEKIGIEGRIANYGKGFLIEFSSDGTEELFERISKYVPECMSYKISDKYWTDECLWDEQKYNRQAYIVQKIEDYEPRNGMKYDIEVEDTHNYFTKSVLVSNSNFRFRHVGDTELMFGSRNVEFKEGDKPLPMEDCNKQFQHAIQYIYNEVDFEELAALPESYVFFGEAMHKHSIDYDVWEGKNPDPSETYPPNFIGFDVYDESSESWLDFDEAMVAFDLIGLETAPVVARKPASEITEEDKGVPRSEYRQPSPDAESAFDRNGLAEGVVIRNIDKDIRAKIVHDEFKEKNAISFNDKSKAQTEAGKFVATYVTDARIEKMIHKLLDEGDWNSVQMQMMEELPRRVIEDVFEEEGWNFVCNNDNVEIEMDDDTKGEIRSKTSKKCARILKEEVNSW
jgi:hypothetical protein